MARRVVADAMPFLVGASGMLVATVVEESRWTARESVEDVARFLTKHGVRARSGVLDDGESAEALIGLAHDIRADLTIAGGFTAVSENGHSAA